MTLDRRDYKSAIPQLEEKINALKKSLTSQQKEIDKLDYSAFRKKVENRLTVISGDVAEETQRAMAAESEVADDLQSETTRATSAENALSDILSETSVSAEQALQSVNEEIVNRLATSLVELGYVQIQNGSIVVSSNASPRSKLQITSSILCILYSNVPKAWVSVSGNKSTFNIDEATISTLRMRNAQGVGTLGWVADENGHLKLKAV